MGPPDPAHRGDPPSDSLYLRSPSWKKDSSKHAGLCKICGSSETCTFPKPEEGVQHCDEYEHARSQPLIFIA
jgi:hypothetical protein